MANEINIAEILATIPKGTKLYDILYNREVELDNVSTIGEETSLWCISKPNKTKTVHYGYSKFGTLRGHEDGLQILKPSKQMRDWSKLAWKKGDVLVSNDEECNVIFEKFTDDSYTSFVGRYYLQDGDYDADTYEGVANSLCTMDYQSELDGNKISAYIGKIEKRLGGELDYKTLDVVPNKPKWTPKPFEKVVAISCADRIWCADIYSHINQLGGYDCIGGNYKKVLPYNEETAKLIGTTDNWEGNV